MTELLVPEFKLVSVYVADWYMRNGLTCSYSDINNFVDVKLKDNNLCSSENKVHGDCMFDFNFNAEFQSSEQVKFPYCFYVDIN